MRRGLVGLAACLSLLGAFPLTAEVQTGPSVAEALREARREGRIGVVAGRVYGEARRTGQAEQALTGTLVRLVPDSAELRAELALVRERARTSPGAQAASSAEVRGVLDRYLRSLGAAGVEDLARVTEVDDEGAFRFEQVPAGTWLLLASRTVQVERRASSAAKKERETFVVKPGLVGYGVVSLWLRELTVSAGQATLLELSDRGTWMTAIEERRGKGAGR